MSYEEKPAKDSSTVEIENIQNIRLTNESDIDKLPVTAYIADDGRSHKKSKEERGLVLKADLLIVPLGALIYFVAYLVRCMLPSFRHKVSMMALANMPLHQDRNTIGNANVLGMQNDLGLSADQ